MRSSLRLMKLIVCCVIVMTGCQPPVDPTLDLIDTNLGKTKVDDLTRTMGFIFSQRRFDQDEFKSTVSGGLNRWVTYAPEKIAADWKIDPLVEPMLDQFEGLAVSERTADFSYVDTDAFYIQESAWISEVVKRVADSTNLGPFEVYRLAADNLQTFDEDQDPVEQVVQRLHEDLAATDAEKLTQAFKVFDWIVRNIQLLPESEPNPGDVDDIRLNERESLAAAGVPGTGYKRYPWQTLLYSRGDYVDRAKLMMIGLQQLKIDSAMLAVKSETGQSRPWAVAVAIGDQFYLFDTRLALPVPGKKTGSFATLAQLRDHPKLLKSLDLTVEESLEEDTQYWLTQDQLDQLVGLVYTSPEAVSKRMLALESRLIGDDRLPLFSQPSEVIGRLPKSTDLEFEVWDTGFKTHQFRQAVREALEDTGNDVLADRLNWYFADESYVDHYPRYRTSRARFFIGNFESPRNSSSLNAIESFERLMFSDDLIDLLATDSTIQRQQGLLKPDGQDVSEFTATIRNVQAQMRLVRRDTGLFLAQSHFDNGNAGAAANWLKTLQGEEDADRWEDSITYLLARSFEARKDYDLALEEYRKNKRSEQAHGNLLRARMLDGLVKKLESE